jgi:hypothetical protein
MKAYRKLLLIACVPVLAGCPPVPPPPGTPQTAPTLSWAVSDLTDHTSIPVSNGAASIRGDHAFAVYFTADDPNGGIGTITLNGTASDIQCGYIDITSPERGTLLSVVNAGRPFDKVLPTVSDTSLDGSTPQFDSYTFNENTNPPRVIRFCPATYQGYAGTVPGGEIAALITFTGAANNFTVPSLQSTSQFFLTVTVAVPIPTSY